MPKFSAEEAILVIRAADEYLDAPARVIIIGGTAIGLLADSSRTTTDIDIYSEAGSEVVMSALVAAKAATGLDVPVQPVTQCFPPDDFEERLVLYPLQGLRYLEVLLPEPHDLALMKIARGYQNDLEAIELLHQEHPLELDILLERFERTYIPGSLTSHELSLLGAIELLFGQEAALNAQSRLEAARRERERVQALIRGK